MSNQTVPGTDEDVFQILDLFYQRGVESVTPTYVAYVLRISPERANNLLDEMVRNSMLELETDDEGHLQYSLPAQEMKRIQEARTEEINRPTPPESGEPEQSTDAGRFDGSLEGADMDAGPRKPSSSDPKTSEQQKQQHHRQQQSMKERAESVLQPTSEDKDVVVLSSAQQTDGSPMLAAFLSLVIPGMGQVYNQEVGKGLLMFFAWFVGWVFLLFWVVSIWSSFDAYQVAQHRGLIEE
jgi:TM2 domain-containing membrane protein YozV